MRTARLNPALPVALAAFAHLLLAAHALRRATGACARPWPPCPCCAFTPGLARLVCSAALLLGAAQWLAAGAQFAQVRLALGEPWLRLALILGSVAVLSLGCGLWLLGGRARALFSKNAATELPQAAAFLLTAGLLALARGKVSAPVLLADRLLPGSGWLAVLALALYAAWLTGRFTHPDHGPGEHRRLRPRIWALFSAAFFLQLALGLSGLTELLMTGRLHLPVPALIAAGPLFRGEGVFMLVLFASTVLLVWVRLVQPPVLTSAPGTTSARGRGALCAALGPFPRPGPWAAGLAALALTPAARAWACAFTGAPAARWRRGWPPCSDWRAWA
jgi:hypothetical protein